jgi:hypothetical protein
LHFFTKKKSVYFFKLQSLFYEGGNEEWGWHLLLELITWVATFSKKKFFSLSTYQGVPHPFLFYLSPVFLWTKIKFSPLVLIE